MLDELALAPAPKRDQATRLLSMVPILPEHPDSDRVIDEYIRHKVMPADARGDAAHLAAASLHGIDFLLTWNCRHLANANKSGHIRTINQRLGLQVPTLTTPLTLIPETRGMTRRRRDEDPVVEEIRAIRRKILKEAGGSTRATSSSFIARPKPPAPRPRRPPRPAET